MKENIFVTRPFLPELKEFIPYLEDIWSSKWLTNEGKFHNELEKELALFLDVPFVSLFSNGTQALIAALRTLEIEGEVITTPYSFVATTHSLLWNNVQPVFADINANDCNIDVSKIEQAITKRTAAILPVHVYGNPCKVAEIEDVSKKYRLPVIYDAAHAFDVKFKGKSILNYGDLSILSFHATKTFHTFEGGAIISPSKKVKEKIDLIRNFGIEDEETISTLGFNAKMNEVQAAIGLLQLKYYKENLLKRKVIADYYKERLINIHGIDFIETDSDVSSNYSYFPVFINAQDAAMSRNALYNHLKSNNVHARKYFYPLISNLPLYKAFPSSGIDNLPVANEKAESVLCLPIYSDLKIDEVNFICDLMDQFFSRK